MFETNNQKPNLLFKMRALLVMGGKGWERQGINTFGV